MRKILTKKNNRRGFTIIELMIYMIILSVLLYVLTNIFVSSLEIKSQSKSQATLQQDSRYILAKLIYDINQASSINFPILGTESDTLEIVVNGQTQTYTINNGNLQLINNLGINNLNSYNTRVSLLRFLHLGNPVTEDRPIPKDNIRIYFRLENNSTINSGREYIEATTTAGLR